MKKIWNILMPFLVYAVVHDIAQIVLAYLAGISVSLAGGIYAEKMLANAQTVNGLLNALAMLIGMAAVWPMARREFWYRKESVTSERDAAAGDRKKKAVSYLLLSVFAISFSLSTNILFILTGVINLSKTYSNIAAGQYGVTFAAGLLIYGIISPIAEETVFRGLIYNRLKTYFKTGISILICGLFFGLYHGNLVQGIYGCILGIAISYMYERYQSFAAPVIFHALANISVFLMGSFTQSEVLVSAAGCAMLLLTAVISMLFILKTDPLI